MEDYRVCLAVDNFSEKQWFQFPLNEEDIKEKFNLEKNARVDEVMIYDYDFPVDLPSEITLQFLNEKYYKLQELPKYVIEKMKEFVDIFGSLEDVENENISLFSDCFTSEDVAYYIVNETDLLGKVDEKVKAYFDFGGYGRDYMANNFWVETSCGLCEVIL